MRSWKSQCRIAGDLPCRHHLRLHRRGYTLVEMMVAISVSGVLMGLAATWIHQALHFSSSIRQRQRHHAGMLQLADQLRNDVRISSSMSLPNENELLLKSADGKEIRYVVSSDWVSLEKKQNNEVLTRERYELAPNAIAQWKSSEMPDWVTLVISRGQIGAGNNSSQAGNAPSSMETTPVDLHVRVGAHRWPEMIQN